MRVLVDTSAWIDFYHPKGDPGVKRHIAHAIEQGAAVIIAPVVAELLAGTRTEEEAQVLREGLRGLYVLPLGWEEAEAAGRLARALGRAGRRIPLVDLLIASAAGQNDCEVWHAGDEHYAAVRAVGGPPERNLREARRS